MVTLTARDVRGGEDDDQTQLDYLPSYARNVFVAEDTGGGDDWDGDDAHASNCPPGDPAPCCGNFLGGEPPLVRPCASLQEGIRRALTFSPPRNVIVTGGRYDEEVVIPPSAYGIAVQGGYARATLVRDLAQTPSVIGTTASSDACPASAGPPFYQTLVVGPPPLGWDPSVDAPPTVEGFTFEGTDGASCWVHTLSSTCSAAGAAGDFSGPAVYSGCPTTNTAGTLGGLAEATASTTVERLNASVTCWGCALNLRDCILRPGGAAMAPGTQAAAVGILAEQSGARPVRVQRTDIRLPFDVSVVSGWASWNVNAFELSDNRFTTAALSSQSRPVRWVSLVLVDGDNTLGGSRAVIERNHLRLDADQTVKPSGDFDPCVAMFIEQLASYEAFVVSNIVELHSDCSPGNVGARNLALWVPGFSPSLHAMIANNLFIATRPGASNAAYGILGALDEGVAVQNNFFGNLDIGAEVGVGCAVQGPRFIRNLFAGTTTSAQSGAYALDASTLNGGVAPTGCDFTDSFGNADLGGGVCFFEQQVDATLASFYRPGPGTPCVNGGSTLVTSHAVAGQAGADDTTAWDASLLDLDFAGAARIVGSAIDIGAVERP